MQQSRNIITDFIDDYSNEPEGSEIARIRSLELGLTPITPSTAACLTLFSKIGNVGNAVEIGTGSGVSALALLAGMLPEAVLTSIDLDIEAQSAAREVFASCQIAARRIRLIAGHPLEVLPKLNDSAYDLVFINGDPLEYVEYVAQADRLLKPAGTLLLHHAFWGGTVADARNDDDEPLIIREALDWIQTSSAYTSALFPIGDGLLVARRQTSPLA
ncbi:MAG: class I SAM-dependent methyltransferase [Propionibacteriaceae bacterium]|nr:class I SAM-dependent methyltransferase [Propionibacteriaceae bacterium]